MFGIIPFKTNSSDEKGGSLGNLFNDFFDDEIFCFGKLPCLSIFLICIICLY